MTTHNFLRFLRRLALGCCLSLSIFCVILGIAIFYGANQPVQGFITTAHDDPGRLQHNEKTKKTCENSLSTPFSFYC